MQVVVEFGTRRVEFHARKDELIAFRLGSPALDDAELKRRTRQVLEEPLDFPPLRQVVVPGDRLVIPVEPGLPGFEVILSEILLILEEAGLGSDVSVTLLATEPLPANMLAAGVASRVPLVVHNPDDTTRIAYLASTAGGRRIYLDRQLTDADVVLPVGWLGYDPIVGYHGPWAEIFPGLSNRDTLLAYHQAGIDSQEHRDRSLLGESAEVSWLLGSQFQVGVEVTTTGVADVLAGESAKLQAHGKKLIDQSYRLRTNRPADLVLAGLGVNWRPTTWSDLADGLANAHNLCRFGGRIVVLSELDALAGPALNFLSTQVDPREGPTLLRGRQNDVDFAEARSIALATSHAEVYLLSKLDSSFVEDLGLIPLETPSQAQKLLDASPSTVVLSPAEWMRAQVFEADPESLPANPSKGS